MPIILVFNSMFIMYYLSFRLRLIKYKTEKKTETEALISFKIMALN